MHAPTLTNSQKAALLIQTMGPQRAAEVLDQLPPEQAGRIRAELQALSQVSNETKRAVLRELRVLAAPAPASAGHTPYLLSLTPDRAAELLTGEPPRLVALLLAVLPVDRGRAIIAGLPTEERTRLKRTLAEVTPPAPLVHQHLEQALRAKAERFQFRETLHGTIAQETLVPASMPVLPAEPPMIPASAPDFTFGMLATLEKSILRAVVTQADLADVVLALRGAEPSFCEHLLHVLPARLRSAIRAQLKQHQPVRLRDIIGAQAALCRVAHTVMIRHAAQYTEKEALHAS
jgi:flagellar motor switch protein FliG